MSSMYQGSSDWTLFQSSEAERCPIVSTWSVPESSHHWGEFQAEGIVARPRVTLFSRNGERIITKVKCRDFG